MFKEEEDNVIPLKKRIVTRYSHLYSDNIIVYRVSNAKYFKYLIEYKNASQFNSMHRTLQAVFEIVLEKSTNDKYDEYLQSELHRLLSKDDAN